MASDPTSEEIAAILDEVKQRVRARHPSGSVELNGTSMRVPLPDLLPLVHARDAAQGKMASIGSVNPRPGGALNNIAQSIKRSISRGMRWFVRDQVTFNREVVACVEAVIEALNDSNRALVMMADQFNARTSEMDRNFAASTTALLDEARSLADIRQHWQAWRAEWEQNLRQNEITHLRALGELQHSFNNRVTHMEAHVARVEESYRAALAASHDAYVAATWGEIEKGVRQFEAVIHSELRVLRQKMEQRGVALSTIPTAAAPVAFDYQRFADRFRGGETHVRRSMEFYLPYFEGHRTLLDIGCGRGEMLELASQHGITARGIDLSADDVAYCHSKGLAAEQADLFPYLDALPDASEDIIFSSQVVEHIDTLRLPEMIRLCASKLRRGGVLALETPNPECLAIFATHFYIDPTHVRPVPSSLLVFYMEECGLGSIKIRTLSPAVESFPEIASLPGDFAAKFFGALDYAILGWKL